MHFIHQNLGPVETTEACVGMQSLNPDPSSLFVEHDGDIIEVTKALCKKAYFRWSLRKANGEKTIYSSNINQRVTADHVRSSPSVIAWAEGKSYSIGPVRN